MFRKVSYMIMACLRSIAFDCHDVRICQIKGIHVHLRLLMGHHAAGHLSQLSTVEICEFMPVPYQANILAVLIDEGIESTQGLVNGDNSDKGIYNHIYICIVYIYIMELCLLGIRCSISTDPRAQENIKPRCFM